MGRVPQTVAVSDTIWEIRLTDGSTIVGQVVASTAERLTVRTLAGAILEMERTLIGRMTLAQGTVREGRLWPLDPNRTRLFFGPTGRMLTAGEGYISVFELVLPFAAVAVSDNTTIAGGTLLIPELIGRVWYVAPKIGWNLNSLTALSGGVLAFVDLGGDRSDDIRSFGVLFLAGTRGGEDHAGARRGVGLLG